MALHMSSNALLFSSGGFSSKRIRAAAAATETVDEGKLKLGGSELKVTQLGIGAWSWGDTSFWNNFLSGMVVLNWLIAQENVVPIPGAKNTEQAQEFAGAIGWKLLKDEVDELRSLASETQPVVGFPVENL